MTEEERIKCIRCGLTCALTEDIYCVHHGGAQIACHDRVDILRKEIDLLKDELKESKEIETGFFNETVRLKAEVDKFEGHVAIRDNQIDFMRQEIGELKSQNHRMRGALESIVRINRGMSYALEFENIAKEALKEVKE